MPEFQVHPDVATWLRGVFRECNERITEKLNNNPNAPEESLDLTWIEHLSRYSSAVTLASSWSVKVEAHYLGGLRHFYRWEIADIGVLLFLRSAGEIRKSKVALLQSKRLYPTNRGVEDEGRCDYELGFARLADPEQLGRAIAVQAEFRFDQQSRYGAIIPGSEQDKAIKEYEKRSKLPVYYQLYNPWSLPFVQRIPLADYAKPQSPIEMGVRIVPAKALHALLPPRNKAYRPSVADLGAGKGVPASYGWMLENFVAD